MASTDLDEFWQVYRVEGDVTQPRKRKPTPTFPEPFVNCDPAPAPRNQPRSAPLWDHRCYKKAITPFNFSLI
ncbi:hypothetical protein BX600DRAFT_462345 [Xylariales sp. PMI_506]|nr:hypothetical protein BX600DRAFT_462345 [Xylariales sp. PMI_506]